jgi:hypothetical protein
MIPSSAPSRRSSGRGAASTAAITTSAVATETCSDAAKARRARRGSPAPMPRAISATHAKPTANRTDWARKKNCAA